MPSCSVSNTTIEIGEALYYIAYQVLMPWYLILGVAGNVTLLLAFYKKSKTEEAYVYQVLLTASKTLEVIVFGSFTLVLHRLVFVEGNNWFKRQFVLMFIYNRLGPVLHIHFIISSLLMATAMAADRVFALAFPYRYRNIKHARHQLVAAVLCFVIPVIPTMPFISVLQVVAVDDHYEAVEDQAFLTSTLMSVLSVAVVVIRVLALGALVTLNVCMVRYFRKRTNDIKMIINSKEKIEAKRQADKTLFLLNFSQSILMCVNQLPHVSMEGMQFLLPDIRFCYEHVITAPLADGLIYLTDIIDLGVVLSINKKMRRMVGEAVCNCGQGQVSAAPTAT